MKYCSIVPIIAVLLLPVTEEQQFIRNMFQWMFPTKPEYTFSPHYCGSLLRKRILGGDQAPPYAWPWMVSLKTFTGRHFCGGVLITNGHVLTAAHCLAVFKYFPYLIRVFVGSGRLEVGDVFNVDSVTIHHSYGTRTMYDSDIAILTLSKPVDFFEGANAVCLPSADLTMSINPVPVTILGWGHTQETKRVVQNLRETLVHILSNEKCRFYGKLYLRDVMICAGQEGGGIDACKGDSGGPLLWQNELGKWEIHGIISFGRGCGSYQYPGIYTKVVQFRYWIYNVII